MTKQKIKSANFTCQDIRRALSYDPKTGEFVWLVRPSNGTMPGTRAGSKNRNRYSTISFLGQAYLAHRLAWLHFYGRWPAEYIDHIDGDPSNNRIENLRECSHQENHRNVERRGYSELQRDTPNRFQAYISIGGKIRYLGVYPTAEEARAVYLAAKNKHHGEFSITRRAEALSKRRHAISTLLRDGSNPESDQKSQQDRARNRSQVAPAPLLAGCVSTHRGHRP